MKYRPEMYEKLGLRMYEKLGLKIMNNRLEIYEK